MIYERQLLVDQALFGFKKVCSYSDKKDFRFPIGSCVKTFIWSDYIWMRGLYMCNQEI